MVRIQRSGMARMGSSAARGVGRVGVAVRAGLLERLPQPRVLGQEPSRASTAARPAAGVGAEAELEDAAGCGGAGCGERKGRRQGHGPVGDVGVEPAGEAVGAWPPRRQGEHEGNAEQGREGEEPLCRRDRLLEGAGCDGQEGGAADEDDDRQRRRERAEEDAGADDPQTRRALRTKMRAAPTPGERASSRTTALLASMMPRNVARAKRTEAGSPLLLPASIAAPTAAPWAPRSSVETRRELVLGTFLGSDGERLERATRSVVSRSRSPSWRSCASRLKKSARPEKPTGELVRSRVAVVGSGLGDPLQFLFEDHELDAGRERGPAALQAALAVAAVGLVPIGCPGERGRELRLRGDLPFRGFEDRPPVAVSLSIPSEALRPRLLHRVPLLLALRLVHEERESSKLFREIRTGAELLEAIDVEGGTEDMLDAVEPAPQPVVCAPRPFQEAGEVPELHPGELLDRLAGLMAEGVLDSGAHEQELERAGNAWITDREGVADDLEVQEAADARGG